MSRFHPINATPARGDTNRPSLITTECHVCLTQGHDHTAASRRAARRVPHLIGIVYRTLGARVAASRNAVRFAMYLANNLAASVQDALDDSGIDLRHVPFQDGAAIHHRHSRHHDVLSLTAMRLPCSGPAAAPLMAVFTYQALCVFSSGGGKEPGVRG